ncbi:MAG: VanZ family protein [Nocardioides sp.]|nr:VanZ family protein [Nocardioides sp.]
MFPVGGVGVMLVGALLSGAVFTALVSVLRHRFGWTWSVCVGLLLWSVVVIGLITLLPANGAPGVVSAEGRLDTCSSDIGGPAPEGFWIFAGGQRLLNTVVFVPSGALVVLVAARWRAGWVLAPLGLLLLAAYSAGIEKTQLELARIDRACDVTDIIDNTTGAAIGVLLGLLLALVVRPWQRR